MLRSALLLCLLSTALSAHAEDSATGAGLAEVEALGLINGVALACNYTEASSRIKSVMIKHSPKSRRYGAAFEEATNKAFLDQTRRAPTTCPDGPTLNEQIDNTTQRLQTVLPAAAAQ